MDKESWESLVTWIFNWRYTTAADYARTPTQTMASQLLGYPPPKTWHIYNINITNKTLLEYSIENKKIEKPTYKKSVL